MKTPIMTPTRGVTKQPATPKGHGLVLPDDLHEHGRRYCEERGMTLSLLVTAFLERELREYIAEAETRWEVAR